MTTPSRLPTGSERERADIEYAILIVRDALREARLGENRSCPMAASSLMWLDSFLTRVAAEWLAASPTEASEEPESWDGASEALKAVPGWGRALSQEVNREWRATYSGPVPPVEPHGQDVEARDLIAAEVQVVVSRTRAYEIADHILAALRTRPVEPEPVGEWEEPAPTCDDCGEPYQVVRPGKWQPVCDCYETCPIHGRKIVYHAAGEYPRTSGYFCADCLFPASPVAPREEKP